jgi:hypothetical protein
MRIIRTNKEVPTRRITKVVAIAILKAPVSRQPSNPAKRILLIQAVIHNNSTNIAMVGFKYKNFVRLQGLSNAAYNGKLAQIKSIKADENTGRYSVELPVVEGSSTFHQISVKPENMVRACDCCYLAGAATMQYCGRCRNAAYCTAECQRSDWMRHKVDCSKMNSHRQIVKSPLHLAAGLGTLAEVQT